MYPRSGSTLREADRLVTLLIAHKFIRVCEHGSLGLPPKCAFVIRCVPVALESQVWEPKTSLIQRNFEAKHKRGIYRVSQVEFAFFLSSTSNHTDADGWKPDQRLPSAFDFVHFFLRSSRRDNHIVP